MDDATKQAWNEIAEAGEMLRRVCWRAVSAGDPLELPDHVMQFLQQARKNVHEAYRWLEHWERVK